MQRQVTVAELVIVGALVGVYGLLSAEPVGISVLRTANWIGPLALMMILALGVYQQVSRIGGALLWPTVWLRIAIAMYFGFGAFFAAIASAQAQEYMRALFQYDDEMLFRLNMLNAVGTWWILAGIAATDRFVGGKKGHDGRQRNGPVVLFSVRVGGAEIANDRWPGSRQIGRGRIEASGSPFSGAASRRAALLWLVVGVAWRVLVDLPSQFGLLEIVVPGAFGVIGLARLAGYALLLADVSPAWRRGRAVVFVLWMGDVILGLATFAKTDTILLGLAFVLAVGIRGASFRQFVVLGLAILLLYAGVRPLVDYGRARLLERYGSLSGGGIVERLTYVGEFLEGQRAPAGVEQEDPWSWLVRFSYVNVQAFVVDRYDRGDSGDTISFSYLATIVVPRILWTDKPVVSDVGLTLYTLATGQYGPSIAPGVVAEAYWNGGWFLLFVVSLYVGLVIGSLGRFTEWVLAGRRTWQFPVVLMGIFIAVRPDGWFGLTYVGGAAMIGLLALAATVLERSASRHRRKKGLYRVKQDNVWLNNA